MKIPLWGPLIEALTQNGVAFEDCSKVAGSERLTYEASIERMDVHLDGRLILTELPNGKTIVHTEEAA